MKINDEVVVHYAGYEIVGAIKLIEPLRVYVIVETCHEICNARPSSALFKGEPVSCKYSEIVVNKRLLAEELDGLKLL